MLGVGSQAKVRVSPNADESVLEGLEDQIVLSGMHAYLKVNRSGNLISSESQSAGVRSDDFPLVVLPCVQGFDPCPVLS